MSVNDNFNLMYRVCGNHLDQKDWDFFSTSKVDHSGEIISDSVELPGLSVVPQHNGYALTIKGLPTRHEAATSDSALVARMGMQNAWKQVLSVQTVQMLESANEHGCSEVRFDNVTRPFEDYLLLDASDGNSLEEFRTELMHRTISPGINPILCVNSSHLHPSDWELLLALKVQESGAILVDDAGDFAINSDPDGFDIQINRKFDGALIAKLKELGISDEVINLCREAAQRDAVAVSFKSGHMPYPGFPLYSTENGEEITAEISRSYG